MGKYTVISTKVNETTQEHLRRICAKKGISIYDMLQMMCDCIVRYMSDATNLSEDIERAMTIFERLDGWKDAFNLADGTTELIIDEALYFVGDEKRKGVRAVLVERPYCGQPRQTVNIQEILERVMNNIIPERYQRMRTKAIQYGCTSILDMIDMILTKHDDEEDMAAVRAEFEDCTRDDYGRQPNDHRYKSKHSKSVNDDRQAVIRFAPDDEPINNN